MNKDEIRAAIMMLAKSQGLYGRILEALTEEDYEHLEAQNFKDIVDMVLYFEGE